MEQNLTIYFNSVGQRYFNRLKHDFYKYLEIARDKHSFIQQQISKARALHFTVSNDPYQSRLIEIVQEGNNLRQSLDSMMPRILKEREEWSNQQFFGMEYNQDYYSVASFVEETDPLHITRFIIRYAVQMKVFAEVLQPELAKLNPETEPALETDQQRATERKVVEKIGQQLTGFPYSFKWNPKKPKEQIKILYKMLREAELIGKETTSQAFTALFRGEQLKERIRWTGTISLLLYLFNELIHAGFIDVPVEIDEHLEVEEKTRSQKQQLSAWLYKRLIYCFTDAASRSFTSASLKDAKKNQAKNRAGKPEKFKIVDDILNNL